MSKKTASDWILSYDSFVPEHEKLRETLCALGNGYMGVRGSAPESAASQVHYPGTYLAGLFNKLGTYVAGKTIYNEDFVNCPNWTFITFKVGDAEWFYPATGCILEHRQELDLREAILRRRVLTQDTKGHRTLVRSSRIVSMDDRHLAAQRYDIVPRNYSDEITIRTMIDGAVKNLGVERYKQLANDHWSLVSLGRSSRDGFHLCMRTSQSRVTVAQAARVRFFTDGRELHPHVRPLTKGRLRIGEEIKLRVRKGAAVVVEKVVGIHSSRERGRGGPKTAAVRTASKAPRFAALFDKHRKAWKRLWYMYDIRVEGDPFAQQVLRLHTLHLIQTASEHNRDLDVSVPARGLNGEAYRGHIFWDEMFAMFFYDLHLPAAAEALLRYRHNRLPEARRYARKDGGYRGSMFPWQSGSRGVEETQVIHLNPMSGEWGPDLSRRQRHVSFAIAFNMWQHYRRTGDRAFLEKCGAEVLLSIALFASSLCRYDRKTGRYHTSGIMGPDEFHEKLPGSQEPGLKDNAYSNVLIVWTLMRAQEALERIPKRQAAGLRRKLKISAAELRRWDDITRKMSLIVDENGIIAQFDGYFDLKELDWEHYRKKYGDIHRMDRILKAEGKSPDAYKLAKQADVLMMFFVLPVYEIRQIFDRLGYEFFPDMMRRNYEYYVQRTSHGSTLSKVVHCYVAQRLGREKEAWDWYKEVLASDINDTQGGTTPEGVHVGVMAGSIDIALRGFAGLTLEEELVRIEPATPQLWTRLAFRFLYKGRWFSLDLTNRRVSVRIDEPLGKRWSFPVEVNGTRRTATPGKWLRFPLGPSLRP